MANKIVTLHPTDSSKDNLYPQVLNHSVKAGQYININATTRVLGTSFPETGNVNTPIYLKSDGTFATCNSYGNASVGNSHYADYSGQLGDEESGQSYSYYDLNNALNEKQDKVKKIGNAVTPVYVSADGTFATCTDYSNASVKHATIADKTTNALQLVQSSNVNNYYTYESLNSALNGKANASDLNNYLKLSGGTMGGNLILKNGAYANGSRQANSKTIPELIDELRKGTGVNGSVDITTAYSFGGKTLPTGWYNFQWIPHRFGEEQNDNSDYGHLIMFPMNFDGEYFYIIRYTNGKIDSLHKLNTDYTFEWVDGGRQPSWVLGGELYNDIKCYNPNLFQVDKAMRLIDSSNYAWSVNASWQHASYIPNNTSYYIAVMESTGGNTALIYTALASNVRVGYSTNSDYANNFSGFGTRNDHTDWGTLTASSGYTIRYGVDLPSGGGMVIAEKNSQAFVQIDGDIYVNEGHSKVATESQVNAKQNKVSWKESNGIVTIKF